METEKCMISKFNNPIRKKSTRLGISKQSPEITLFI